MRKSKTKANRALGLQHVSGVLTCVAAMGWGAPALAQDAPIMIEPTQTGEIRSWIDNALYLDPDTPLPDHPKLWRASICEAVTSEIVDGLDEAIVWSPDDQEFVPTPEWRRWRAWSERLATRSETSDEIDTASPGYVWVQNQLDRAIAAGRPSDERLAALSAQCAAFERG